MLVLIVTFAIGCIIYNTFRTDRRQTDDRRRRTQHCTV